MRYVCKSVDRVVCVGNSIHHLQSIYQEASRAAAKWACAEITTRSTCTSYLSVNGEEGTIWKELVQDVGSGGGVAEENNEHDEDTDGHRKDRQQHKEMAVYE